MTATKLVSTLLVVAAALSSAACPIAANDPIEGYGQKCAVDEGACGVDFVCAPDAAGQSAGHCAPVSTFGSCPAPTWPPGTLGVEDTVVTVKTKADLGTIQNLLRSVDGDVFFNGASNDLAIGNLCTLHSLQRVGGTLSISGTDIPNLDGLQSVSSVGKGIALYGNAQLTSIEGLSAVVSLSPRTFSGGKSYLAVIADNNNLSLTQIDSFVTSLSARLGKDRKDVLSQLLLCNNSGHNTSSGGDCTAVATFLSALSRRSQ